MKTLEAFAIQLLALVLSVAATAFAQTDQSTPHSAAEALQGSPQSGGSQVSQDRPVLQHRNPRYQVMRDDVIIISFPLSPELNQAVTVQPDGYVSLQNVGGLYIQGMTVPEIVEAVKKAYAKILHDPIVDVDLSDFQKPYFVVLGQVGKPGQYDLRYDMTVTQAVAVAGGFSATAKTQLLLYHPISPTTMEVKKLNIKDILNGKNVNEQVHVSSGDMIFVPEKTITKFRKYVPYGIGTGYNVGYY
ncbi:MAG: polysaccharide biosynthesis/export family protein [Candidatus Acidiferrum sp.]